jgi:hypothetical protein
LITILNSQYKPDAVLDEYFDDQVFEQINGSYTLKFSVYLDHDKSQYIQIGSYAEVEGQYFNIVHHRRTRSESGDVVIAVECEHVSYDLLFHSFDQFIHTGTPRELLQYALGGTGFTIGAVELTDLISVEFKEITNVRGIVMAIAAASGGEMKFDNHVISLLRRRGREHSVQFRFGKNLKGIVKDVDAKTGNIVTSYEVSVVELNSLPQFAGLEYFELGDTVGVIDEEIMINEKQRIIQYTYSPRLRINSGVVIANAIYSLQDTVYRIQQTTVAKDRWMYGVKIGPDQGIVQERYDKLSRSIWNADEFRMQKGDGNGSYEDVLFFDPVNREYEFSGIVRAGQFIGGSIEIGSNFSVDESGHMIAEGAEFSGEIKASTIRGGEIYGSYIEGADILGSTIRTAASGERIVLDPYGFEFFDNGNNLRVTLGTNDVVNISGHTYWNRHSQPMGLVYAIDDELHVIGNDNLRIGTNFGTTYAQGGVWRFSGIVDFSDAEVRGL